MEVAVAEEKKKIFRARKTMKISDRQQLESLHSTLSSPAPSLSNSSNSNSPSTPSPLTNGTHTEDRQKVADGETNDITDSKNSRSTTPVSPACLTSRSPPLALSLSLSASPPSPENPKAKEDTNPSPSSPFHNINDMLKQMEEEGKEDDSPTALSNKEMEREHTEAAKTNKKEEKDPGTEIEDACTTTGKRPEDQAPMDQSPVDSPFSSVTDDKEPGKDKETEKEEDSVAMETDTNKDHTDTKASEVSISTATEEKPSTPKASTMASSPSSPTPSPSAVPEMDANIKDKEVQNTGEKKKVDSQEEEDVVRKEEKMEVVSVKDLINEKRNVAESSASSSLSTCKVEKGLKIKEEHTSSPGQKRHLSDDDERNGVKVERDGKRQRVQGVELEAQLELKITANSGSRQKLEKFVHKMVAERLRVLQLTVFDQGLQELKDRVEKIDCATKHQSTLNTLQAKIARLAKKFGEANQASENKRKHEMLQNLDEMESDGGSEIESDGGSEIVPEIDVSDDGCSSESDIEPPPPMPEPRRRKTRKEPTETTTAAVRQESGRDGTIWIKASNKSAPGMSPFPNILTEAAGPTTHAKSRIGSALDSFLCLVDMEMLQHIRDCTVTYAYRKGLVLWDMSVDELKAFIALLYVRGAYGGKTVKLESFWSDRYGLDFFRETMTRNRFREIMQHLRFDYKETREQRLVKDKFAAVSDTWESFVKNSIACYKPGKNITVDEQLFPTTARCRFTQYMANKPDTFGIKFWLAVDVDTKYLLNGYPYLGKDETRTAGEQLSETVVLRLTEPFTFEGRTVTTHNAFTSLSLAEKLMAKKTSLLGTMNKQRRELPPCAQNSTPAELYSTTVMTSGEATLTVYRCKKNENMCLLSTMHPCVSITNGLKKKPETVTDYNHSKVGVDTLAQMARLYSVMGGTRRWPVAVFYNLLDLAAINAHVLYEKCLGKTISRRDFIMDLAFELRGNHMIAKRATKEAAKEARFARPRYLPLPQPLPPGKKIQCQVRMCTRNKTNEYCVVCNRFVCVSCSHKPLKLCADCGQEE